MRKLFAVAAALAALFAIAPGSAVQAGGHGYYICWNTPGGNSDCASLPSNYHIKGVEKPYCAHSDRCRHSQTEFVLTNQRIRCLSRYVDTTTMAPTHTAVIYAPRS